MIDNARIEKMTNDIRNFVKEHKPIYFFYNDVTKIAPDVFALFKILNVNLKAVLTRNPNEKELAGHQCRLLASVAPKFNAKTGVIILTKKPSPQPQHTMICDVQGKNYRAPAFAITNDEAMIMYDRITIMNSLQQYSKDGFDELKFRDIIQKYFRGLSTFLNTKSETLKYRLLQTYFVKKPVYDIDDTAIVIQGPITYENDYTAYTVRFYREIYPNIPIVISTWRGGVRDTFRESCRQHNAIILENELPANPGFGNMNLQMESSERGVEYVRKNTSAKFILKCRTDQRIFRPDFLIYFKNLLKAFPTYGDKLKARLVVPAYSHKWIPFFVGDLFVFGTAEDMAKLYSVRTELEFSEKHKMHPHKGMIHRIIERFELVAGYKIPNEKKRVKYNLFMDRMENISAEVVIAKNFYRKFFAPIEPENLLEDYWKFFRDCLVSANEEDLLLDWQKYYFDNTVQVGGCYSIRHAYDTNERMDYINWLDLYLNYKREDFQK